MALIVVILVELTGNFLFDWDVQYLFELFCDFYGDIVMKIDTFGFEIILLGYKERWYIEPDIVDVHGFQKFAANQGQVGPLFWELSIEIL